MPRENSHRRSRRQNKHNRQQKRDPLSARLVFAIVHSHLQPPDYTAILLARHRSGNVANVAIRRRWFVA
jgi:hypothetical protein